MKIEIVFSRNWFDRRNVVPVVLTMKRSGLWTLLLAAIFVCAPDSSEAGVIDAWVRQHNNLVTNSFDQASKVVVDKAGDVIVAGYTHQGTSGFDMLTIKYSGKDGSLIWKRLYDGPAHENDQTRALATDENDNVIITGTSLTTAHNIDFYTAKYSASDGALLWERRYDGPINGSDSPQAVAIDRSGNVIVTGSSAAGTAQTHFYTAKYAADDGAILWEQRYGSPLQNFDGARGLAVDNNGDVLVTGVSHGQGTDTDYYTVKYAAADGAILWAQRYNGQGNLYDNAYAITVDVAGNAIVTGSSDGLRGVFGNTYHVVKYAAVDGALIWEQRGPVGFPVAISTDPSGNVVVTGYSFDYSTTTDADYYTAKYAATDGALLWEKRYDGGVNWRDYAQALAVDRSGNVLVTGYSFNGTNYDYHTTKYAAADGALLWERRFSGAANRGDYARSVATDRNGDVIVTGQTYHGGASADLHTEKYDRATGALLWRTNYNGPVNGFDQPQAIALDADNNITITGGSGYGPDHVSYTAKYAAANGAILWERRYDGPENTGNSPAVVVLDAQGNAIVAGVEFLSFKEPGTSFYPEIARQFTAKYASSDGASLWQKAGPHGYAEAAAVLPGGDVVVAGSSESGTTYSWYIARYASLDGTLIWENRGPPGSAEAVAVDAFGDVLASGKESGGGFYTVKYRGTNGAVLWVKRYSGSGTATDRARALAVDPHGNVAVTGSASNGRDLDFYTAKYRAADGFLLWERRYSGITNGNDEAKALAVDRNGNVIVTGFSWNGTNYNDSYTAKYAALDGALFWERRRLAGSGEAVAVDAADDVVVAGNSRAGTYSDYYTAKYAAADGALIWEKQYNGVNGRNDTLLTSRSLAVSGNGVIAVTGSSDTGLSRGDSYDFATVVYWENLPPVSIDILSAAVRARFSAIPGRVYEVQRASDIEGPWTTLSTQTAPANGLIEYLDNTPPGGSTFYRIRTD